MTLLIKFLFSVYRSSFEAVTKSQPLKEFLTVAQDTKDAIMIRRWRQFHLTTLHPLDLEAVRIIKENCHLFHKLSVKGVRDEDCCSGKTYVSGCFNRLKAVLLFNPWTQTVPIDT
jgi:hypothetical protein